MREIKFRIYDTKRKEWVHDTKHAVNLLGETIILGDILRRPDDTRVRLEELNDLVVMQFTGLKDRNGIEVYEGDVIRNDGGDWNEEVFYEEGGFCFCREAPEPMVWLQINGVYEVIGNVHENPELIKDTAEILS